MDEMTDEERAELARRVVAQRKAKYGTASGAYRTAGVNATTWKRVETGMPVREDILIAAVRTLWPASDGDWRRIDATEAPPPDAARVGRWLTELQDRVAALEAWRIDQEANDHDDPTPKTPAGADDAPADPVDVEMISGEGIVDPGPQRPPAARHRGERKTRR